MLAQQRHRRILEIVQANGGARVVDLARELEVTEETIRRDLQQLEKNDLLVRQHGGALSKRLASSDAAFAEREETLVEEKRIIAAMALPLLHEGDTVFLDSSTTVLQLARLIPTMNLTVVTHSRHVVDVLRNNSEVTVISTGGVLHRDSNSFLGTIAERFIESFHVDKAFMSCRSVDLKWGASEGSEQAATLKARAINNADQAYLLADHTKLGSRSMARIAPMNAFQQLISDR